MNEENKRIDLVSLKICRDKSVPYGADVIGNPQSAYDIIKKFIGNTDREYFLVMTLSNSNQPCAVEICSIGTLTYTFVHPREVFKLAIRTNASKIMLAHTHPSNNTKPSPNDIEITKELIEISKLLQIPIIDHLVVGEDNYFSFAEHRLLFNGDES